MSTIMRSDVMMRYCRSILPKIVAIGADDLIYPIPLLDIGTCFSNVLVSESQSVHPYEARS